MENQEVGIDILMEARVISIIKLIYKKEKITTTNLRDDIPGGYDKLKTLADKLVNIGIIKKDVEERPHLRREYTLTEKGKKVAELLDQIDQVIRS